MLMGWRKVLVLAPHTDDGEFGCGGTLSRLVEGGSEVRYVAFSIATGACPRFPRIPGREVRDRRRARIPRSSGRPRLECAPPGAPAGIIEL